MYISEYVFEEVLACEETNRIDCLITICPTEHVITTLLQACIGHIAMRIKWNLD